MKTAAIVVFIILLLGYSISLTAWFTADLYEERGIRSRHRLTPRLELVIDSGRVDTVFVYKLQP